MIQSIEEFLPLVSKPGRYVGGEMNSVDKDWDRAKVRVALAFPETYEIGMSHIGIKILYHIINANHSPQIGSLAYIPVAVRIIKIHHSGRSHQKMLFHSSDRKSRAEIMGFL